MKLGLWDRIIIGGEIEEMLEKGYSRKRIDKEVKKLEQSLADRQATEGGKNGHK